MKWTPIKGRMNILLRTALLNAFPTPLPTSGTSVEEYLQKARKQKRSTRKRRRRKISINKRSLNGMKLESKDHETELDILETYSKGFLIDGGDVPRRQGWYLSRTSGMRRCLDRCLSLQLPNRLVCSTPAVRRSIDIESSPENVQHQLQNRKRTPPDRSLVTSTPGAVLQESLQVGRQMLGWDSNPSPQIEGRVASPLYQARTIVPRASAPHTAAGPECWLESRGAV
ncbi:unnamed protein product [Caenorhabditis auriculariae]|uniref:Uncharacterized protein n=1 Tax=Caenorhabditis auriculariae TaxID=2777116 RepID=A0A8S1HR83_9PELO|nr:unnamed protein product [Caenorhabditis auriculariae]